MCLLTIGSNQESFLVEIVLQRHQNVVAMKYLKSASHLRRGNIGDIAKYAMTSHVS